MPELGMSGSVGAWGEQSPQVTRQQPGCGKKLDKIPGACSMQCNFAVTVYRPSLLAGLIAWCVVTAVAARCCV